MVAGVHLARRDGLDIAHAVLMRQAAAHHIADDLHVAVRMRPEALARRDPRIMADLECAIERARAERQHIQLTHGRAWVAHRPVGTFNAAYTGPRVHFKVSPVTGLPMHIQYVAL